jgi:hypothetical protein
MIEAIAVLTPAVFIPAGASGRERGAAEGGVGTAAAVGGVQGITGGVGNGGAAGVATGMGVGDAGEGVEVPPDGFRG